MDHPRLVGWSSLHRIRRRSLTSLCRRSGTASPVPEPEGSWLGSHLAMQALHSPARPRPPPCRALRDDMSSNQDAFRRVVTDSVARVVETVNALWFDRVTQSHTPFSPGSRRVVCQHVVRSAPGPESRSRFALRLLVRHDARCVGPTSAFSRSSYQYPRLVGSRCVAALSR